MENHKSGGKFAGSHTTYIDEAKDLIKIADKMPEVTKIVLGPIKNMKGLRLSIKYFEIGAGWKIVLCGQTARQEIFFYTKDRELVQKTLEKNFRG